MRALARLTIIGLTAATGCAHHAVVDDGSSLSFGDPREGVLINPARLPASGLGFYAPDRWERRGLRYGVDELISLIVWTGRELDRAHPGAAFAVADLSKPGGGPSAWHRSHQHGRDVDIVFITRSRSDRPQRPDEMRRFAASGVVIGRGGEPVAPEPDVYFDVKRNWTLIKLLLSNPISDVQYIFVSDDLKQTLIDHAVASGEPADLIARAGYLLHQPSDSMAHDDHFHVRIYCPQNDLDYGCRDRGAVRWLKKVYKYDRPVARHGFSRLVAFINRSSRVLMVTLAGLPARGFVLD